MTRRILPYQSIFNTQHQIPTQGGGSVAPGGHIQTNRKLIYAATSRAVLPIVAAVVAGGAFSESPQVQAKPFSAAQQQFSGFEPQGTIFSTTPQGWMLQSPDVFVKPFNAAQQQSQCNAYPYFPIVGAGNVEPVITNYSTVIDEGNAFEPLGTVAAFNKWGWSSESPQTKVNAFSAAQQQFGSAFTPQGAIFSITPQGWASESPVLLGKPYNTAQQQVTGWLPQPYFQRVGGYSTDVDIVSSSVILDEPAFAPTPIVSTTQFTNWGWASESPQVAAKPYNVTLQQVQAFAPQGSFQFTNWGWASESPVLSAKAYNSAQQQFQAFAPRGSFVFTNWGWSSEHPQVSVKPYGTAQQQFTCFPGYGTIFSTTPQGWMLQSPDVFVKPFNAAQQQVTYGPVFPYVSAVFTNWGWSSESPALLGKPFNVAQQQFGSAFTPQGTIFSTTPQGWMFQPPILLAKPYNVTLQQTTAWTPFTPTVAATPSAFGTTGDSLIIVNATVLYDAMTGAPFMVPATLGFVQPVQWDVYPKPFNAVQQQFQAFAPRGTIFSTTPQGWMLQSPDLFIKPFNAAQQQVTYGPVFPYLSAVQPIIATVASSYTVTSTTNVIYHAAANIIPAPPQFSAWGWSSEHPNLLIPKFNTAQQQFQAFAPQGSFQFINWGWASESPQFHISPLYSVSLQQSITTAVQQVPTATTPHGFEPVIFHPIVRGFNAAQQQVTSTPPFPFVGTNPVVSTVVHNLPWFATMGKVKSF